MILAVTFILLLKTINFRALDAWERDRVLIFHLYMILTMHFEHARTHI